MKRSLYDYCIEQENSELLLQWHPALNEPMTPKSVSPGSQKKVWWRCKQGHEWQVAVHTRTGKHTGCPYCAGRILLPGKNDFASQNPELAKQWHPTKNNGLKPDQVFSHTTQKVWWICEKRHEWQTRISNRVNGDRCPICTNRKILPKNNDLASTHPSLAKQWHPTKNESLTPEKVVSGSSRKVWWQCNQGHEWCATIKARAHQGTGCPICAGKTTVPGETDLATAFPEIAAEWHSFRNGATTPQNVPVFSNHKAWWICPLGHEYQSTTAHRTHGGSGCPYCAGRRILPGFNDLATREPGVASQWHPSLNGTLTPEQVTTGSSKKVWWECSNGHVWKAVVYSRASGKKHGCPVCAGTIKSKRQKRYAAAMKD